MMRKFLPPYQSAAGRYGASALRWSASLLSVFALTILLSRPANAAPCGPENIRWASSSNNVYVMGAGTVCTLTEIDAIADKANIQPVSPGVWFVGSNIWLQGGATLNLHGSASGGDVDELRLRSDSAVVFVRAYWGTLDIKDTKITSWTGNGPDTDSGNPRPYLQVKSFLEGEIPRESTMNIANADIGYLGYFAAESYGLSWKVLGTGAGLFDKVGVKGTITSSHIHHNYYGAYTWGADAMTWAGNEFDNNKLYGLDPHDNSDNLTITNNTFHHNGTHGLICSRYCDHLTIRNNKAYNNGGNGFMLHRLTNESLVEDNETYNNTDSGLAVFDSHNNTIHRNNFHDNAKGIRFSVGSSNNIITDNKITNNSKYGLYFFKGSDTPTESGDGRLRNNRFENNLISGNKEVGLSISDSPDQVINKNTIEKNGPTGIHVKSGSTGVKITNNIIRSHSKYGILSEKGTNATISGNTFSNNGKNVGP